MDTLRQPRSPRRAGNPRIQIKSVGPRRLPPAALVLLAAALLLPSWAPASEGVLALTTDWTVGGIVSLSTAAPWSVSADLGVTCGDAVGRWRRGRLYMINRSGCDNIEVLDPASGWRVVREFSVGPGSNPQDIAFVSDTRAYVSRYESNWLLEVNPETGAILDSLSLAVFADTVDGLCEMHRMLVLGDRLFVEVQRWIRQGFNWRPNPPSVLAVVDLDNRTLFDVDPDTPGVQGIRLSGTNPSAPLQIDRFTGDLLVPEAGVNGKVDQGGIERVDPLGLRSTGFLIGERELGGDLVDFAQWADTLAYAIAADTAGKTSLVSINPRTGRRREVLYGAGGYFLFDCLVTSEGLLYVADQTYSDPGVRIYQAPTGRLLSDGPVRTGRPPFELLLWDPQVFPDTTAPADALLGQPWPNPSKERFRLRWPETAPPPLAAEIYDLSGRLVRSLHWPGTASPEALTWDGRDAWQDPAASGVYLFRIRLAGGGILRRTAALIR